MVFVKIMYIISIRNLNFKLVYIRPIVKNFFSILWEILRKNKSIYLANAVDDFTSTSGAYMEGLFSSNSFIEHIFVEQQLYARYSVLVIMVRGMMPKYIPSGNWEFIILNPQREQNRCYKKKGQDGTIVLNYNCFKCTSQK